MTASSLALQLLLLFLFACGAAAFAALLKGCFRLRRSGSHILEPDVLLKSPLLPPISVLTAPYGTSPASLKFVRRLLALHYSKHEVVVVLDAPDEADLAAWTAEFRLGLSSRRSSNRLPSAPILAVYESHDPIRLVVVHQQHGAPETALNNALNLAAFPVIGLIEPGSEFQPSVLLHLISPLIDEPDSITAVCGCGPAPSAGKTWSERFGALAFLRMWLARCAAFDASGSMVPVPGAAMLVRAERIVAANGFRPTLLELSLHLEGQAQRERRPFRTALVAEPISYWPLPTTWAALVRFDARDQAEIGSAVRHHGRIAGGFGSAGRALPSLAVARLFRPLAETAAYAITAGAWLAGGIGGAMAGGILLAIGGMGMLLSVASVVLWDLSRAEGTDPAVLARLCAAAVPENLGYRQIRNLWLIAGFFRPWPPNGTRKPAARPDKGS